jgi:hypothetical protein
MNISVTNDLEEITKDEFHMGFGIKLNFDCEKRSFWKSGIKFVLESTKKNENSWTEIESLDFFQFYIDEQIQFIIMLETM